MLASPLLINSLRVVGCTAGLGIGGWSIRRQFDSDSKVGHLFLTTIAASMLVRYSLKGVLPNLVGRYKWFEKAALPLGCFLGTFALNGCHSKKAYLQGGRYFEPDDDEIKMTGPAWRMKHKVDLLATPTQAVVLFGLFLLAGALVRHSLRHQLPHILHLMPRHLAFGLAGGYVASRLLLHAASGSGGRGEVEGSANYALHIIGGMAVFAGAVVAIDRFSSALKLLTTRYWPA